MNWKPKMKLKCTQCHKVSKMIVSKFSPVDHNDETDFRVKCKLCGDDSCVTEDVLREMQEEAIGGNK